MKILKLLNNKYLSIILIFFLLSFNLSSEEKPVDIWNIDQNKIDKTNSDQNNIKIVNEQITQSSVYDQQSQKEIDSVQIDLSLKSQEINI